nr:ABC transporter substrate-binding protein [Microseira wollei]
MSLFGGDSLYEGLNLSIGKRDIEGLQLVIPWFPVNLDGQMISDYAREAKETWGGQINWVTASSYDATRAFLAAISQAEKTYRRVDRKSVLESLPKVVLEKEFTSGEKLEFQNGERQGGKPVFVEVVQKEKLPKILQCSFEVCFKPFEVKKPNTKH